MLSGNSSGSTASHSALLSALPSVVPNGSASVPFAQVEAGCGVR